jgi:hypothetical protein
MTRIFLVLWLVLSSACAHHPKRVDCDGHVVAINPPNPVVKGSAAAAMP